MTDTLDKSQTDNQAEIEIKSTNSDHEITAAPKPVAEVESEPQAYVAELSGGEANTAAAAEAVGAEAETEGAAEVVTEDVVAVEAADAEIEKDVEAEAEEPAEIVTELAEAEVVEAATANETAPVSEAVEAAEPVQASAAPDPLEQVRDLLFGETRSALEAKLERAQAELLDRIVALEGRVETEHATHFGVVGAIAQLGESVQNLIPKHRED